MRLVLLGPPGAGKGTHARVLSERYDTPHLATGDIFRSHIQRKTPLGLQAQDIIEKGNLVPDDLVNQMMLEEISSLDPDKGFILDGYPRTVGQAKALDRFLKESGISLDVVLNFDTSEKVIVDRLSGRRVCPKCGRNFHLRNIPPQKEGICDTEGEKLIQRKDDAPETIRHRLKTYEKETRPVVDYYKRQKVLKPVPADDKVPKLQEKLRVLFEELRLAI